MTENTNTTSDVTTNCKCYNRGREDMRNAVLEILERGILPKSGLEPLSVANFASESKVERSSTL